MNPLIQLKTTPLLLIALALFGFALSPRAQAVVPPPDGGYPNFTTAEGTKALQSLTTGSANTAVGWFSLFSNAGGSFNTATGAGTLLFNTADANTAFGTATLLFNTTGFQNTAVGTAVLLTNTTGNGNTATGIDALFSNTEGNFNTANGVFAFSNNTTGRNSTATGVGVLEDNTTDIDNTATDSNALGSNTMGTSNTANGSLTLGGNATGNNNTGIGYFALIHANGNSNTALGFQAGENQTTGSNNVYIGAELVGVAGETNACYIASIFGQTSGGGAPVLINATGKLGTTTSSKRFKTDIKPMDKASEALYSLEPVTFRYKKEVDPTQIPQLGLVAEEVEKVNPDLVVRDKEGKPYSVRYDQVNAMLLNEVLKEHRKNEEQQKQINVLTAQLNEQAAQIQKVSAQLKASKPTPQVVNNP